MAPNVTSNTSLCRVKNGFLNGVRMNDSLNVRTECIIRHIYSYLLSSDYNFEDLPPLNSRETTILEALKSVSDEFKSCYADEISEMTSSLELSPETVSICFLGISNELFCEGITWSRIATYIVFAGELAIQCLHRNFPDYLVEDIYDCLLKFTRDNLEKWVQDHGAWEGIMIFVNGAKKKEVQQPVSTTSSSTVLQSSSTSSGWAKSALYGTVRVLGTLAYLANLTTDPSESFPMHSS